MRLKFLLLFFMLNICGALWSADSALDSYLGRSSGYEDVVVQDVISADTIKLDNDEYVYLIGLIAPEAPRRKIEDVERDKYGFVLKDPVSPETPIEIQALDFAQELLKGKHVRLEFDVEIKNKEFKTQGYVFLLDNGQMANAEILRQGYAKLRIQPPNLKYETQLRDAYKEARDEKRGLQGE